MKKITLFAFFIIFVFSIGGIASGQIKSAPAEKIKPSFGSESKKALEKEDVTDSKKLSDSEKTTPKTSATKKVIKKTGAAAATVVGTKKVSGALTDKGPGTLTDKKSE